MDPRAADSALTAPVINTSPGPEYSDSLRLFQGIPGIERAANGRLWAVWYGGGTGEEGENYVMVATSIDDGETWSPIRMVIDPPAPVRAFDPCLWRDPEGRLWLFWAQSFHHFDGRAGVWAIYTEDAESETPNWSTPRRLFNGVMMNKPLVLTGGEWLMPVCVWPWSTRPDIPEEEKRPNVFVSTDMGKTFALRGGPQVPGEPSEVRPCEHMVIEKLDGSLWMLVRTTYGIGESFSDDRGFNWTVLRPCVIRHTASRFFIRRLASGKLLLVKHGPIDVQTDRSHLMAFLSSDDGESWHGGLMIDEREGVSYPDAVQADDGTIYLIYDYSRRGDKQILMARFTEDDVEGGKICTENSRLRLLVNQATGMT